MYSAEPATPHRTLAHVGITVPDLDLAVRWYSHVIGFDVMVPAHSIVRDEGHPGRVAADVLGPEFGALRQAHLVGANGAGLELFEFVEPPVGRLESSRPYWSTGPWHVCIVDPDVEATAEAIRRSGGDRTSRVWRLFDDEPYEMTYCEDPFGNIVEIYSHSYERIYSNRVIA
ncbi:MAG: VOC family protein [Solirubrobacteraceae bacterium]